MRIGWFWLGGDLFVLTNDGTLFENWQTQVLPPTLPPLAVACFTSLFVSERGTFYEMPARVFLVMLLVFHVIEHACVILHSSASGLRRMSCSRSLRRQIVCSSSIVRQSVLVCVRGRALIDCIPDRIHATRFCCVLPRTRTLRHAGCRHALRNLYFFSSHPLELTQANARFLFRPDSFNPPS